MRGGAAAALGRLPARGRHDRGAAGGHFFAVAVPGEGVAAGAKAARRAAGPRQKRLKQSSDFI